MTGARILQVAEGEGMMVRFEATKARYRSDWMTAGASRPCRDKLNRVMDILDRNRYALDRQRIVELASIEGRVDHRRGRFDDRLGIAGAVLFLKKG